MKGDIFFKVNNFVIGLQLKEVIIVFYMKCYGIDDEKEEPYLNLHNKFDMDYLKGYKKNIIYFIIN